MTTLHVDCLSCRVRGPACSDCVISALLGPPSVEFGEAERQALGVLSAGGLLPPLRMSGGPDQDAEAI